MTIGFVARDACPLCSDRNPRLLVDLSYGEPRLARFIEDFYRGRVPLEAITDAIYRVVQCRQCGLVYQDPMLDSVGMQALYEDWVDQARSLDKKQQKMPRLEKQYRGQLQTLAKLFPGAPERVRILEFGMGWGYWSLQAQRFGYQVSGFELSQRRRAHAISLGVHAIERLPSTAQFECIFANQVFEHLPEPRQTLTELVSCLMPDGVIYLRVPDGRGVAETLESDGWSAGMDAVHPLEHINCFTRKTLVRLGASCGLQAFNPPPRLAMGRLWGGIKREFVDRYLTTHVFFRRRRRGL